MHHELTPSQENYLEHIYNMSAKGKIRTRDLAKSVGVKLPSVTRAVQKLTDAGMVIHETYGEIEITAAGKDAARSVKRRDDCLVNFLERVLDLPSDQARIEACRIEHVISESVLRRLEVLVDYFSPTTAWKKKLRKELKRSLSRADDINRTEVGRSKPHA